MRALTAQQLLTVWESGQGHGSAQQALALLVAACPSESVESLSSLSIGQRDARLLRLRDWIFGPQLAGIADCPKCSEHLEMSFSSDEIRAGEEELSQPLSLDFEDYSISFRLPNSTDLMALSNAVDRNEAKQALIERCVLQANQRDVQLEAGQLSESVVEAISQRMADVDPQADIQLALNCPACSYQWRAAFDIVTFFWNEIGAWARRVLREVHILASAYGWREEDILKMSPRRRQMYLEMLGA